jgi:hypothetical protein
MRSRQDIETQGSMPGAHIGAMSADDRQPTVAGRPMADGWPTGPWPDPAAVQIKAARIVPSFDGLIVRAETGRPVGRPAGRCFDDGGIGR